MVKISVVASMLLCALSCALFGCGGSGSSPAAVQPPTPTITSVSPNTISPGQVFAISGTNLAGSSTYLNFEANGNETAGPAVSGNSTKVTGEIPVVLPAGTYNMFVITRNGSQESQPSNTVSVTIQ
jgi:hypothetical protein